MRKRETARELQSLSPLSVSNREREREGEGENVKPNKD
jgi:hypothetical protein